MLVGDKVIVNYSNGIPVVGVIKSIQGDRASVLIDGNITLTNIKLITLRKF